MTYPWKHRVWNLWHPLSPMMASGFLTPHKVTRWPGLSSCAHFFYFDHHFLLSVCLLQDTVLCSFYMRLNGYKNYKTNICSLKHKQKHLKWKIKVLPSFLASYPNTHPHPHPCSLGITIVISLVYIPSGHFLSMCVSTCGYTNIKSCYAYYYMSCFFPTRQYHIGILACKSIQVYVILFNGCPLLIWQS